MRVGGVSTNPLQGIEAIHERHFQIEDDRERKMRAAGLKRRLNFQAIGTMLEVQMRAHRGETTFSEVRVVVAIIREQNERRLEHIRNDNVRTVRGTQSRTRKESRLVLFLKGSA